MARVRTSIEFGTKRKRWHILRHQTDGTSKVVMLVGTETMAGVIARLMERTTQFPGTTYTVEQVWV